MEWPSAPPPTPREPDCLLDHEIKPGPGIGVDVIAPKEGTTESKSNDRIPLIVNASDMDQLRQKCQCLDGESPPSWRQVEIMDSVKYKWSIVSVTGTGRFYRRPTSPRERTVRGDDPDVDRGKLLSTDGPATLYEPPNLEIGETVTVTIKVEITDSRGNDAPAWVRFKITLKRLEDCKYNRQISIEKKTDKGDASVVTPRAARCWPTREKWDPAPALSGDTAGTLKVCVGERVVLKANGGDNDTLELYCASNSCSAAKKKLSMIDEMKYTWTATRGGFPDHGGGAVTNSKSTTAIYKAPDTPGEDIVTVIIQDSGQQAPDGPVKKQIKIKVYKVDLQIDGVSEEDEECEGTHLCLNRDDDDENKTIDGKQTGSVTGEDDLLKITLVKEPKDGKVTLTARQGDQKIKVWTKKTKVKEVKLPATFPASELPKTLWVEGVEVSDKLRDVELRLESDEPRCQDSGKLTVTTVDLDGDADHDRTVEENAEDDGPENDLPGVVTLANVDDDDKDGNKDNQGAEAATIDNGAPENDFDDLAPILLRRIPVLPRGWSVELTLHAPTNVAAGVGAGDVVRLFADHRGANATVIMGPGTTKFVLPENAPHNVDLAHLRAGDVEIGVEGLEFAGEVKLKVELKDDTGKLVCSDQIQLKVSPLLLLGHLQNATRSFVAQIVGAESAAYCTVRFPGATPGGITDEVIPPALSGGDVWAQDKFQVGFQQAPYKEWHVVLDSKRDRGLNAFPRRSNALAPPGLLGPDFGHIQVSAGGAANSLDSFGNLEVSPPCKVGGKDYPFGRIYYGDNPVGRRMDSSLRDFLLRQRVQEPVTFNSDWLVVGHVDEFMSIAPDAGGTHGWKVVLADPQSAVNILAGGGGRPGVDPNLHIPRYTDFNIGVAVINTAGALQARPLDAAVPAGSANIRDYNLNEATDILFGPPAAGHNGGLKGDIRAAFGLVNADFIEVPVLFNRVPGGRSVAITPGLANGAVYGGVYIAPDNFLHSVGGAEEDADSDFRLDAGEDANANGRLDTLRDPFHVYSNSVFPAGVTATYIDDWSVYHLGDGEVHCGSNEVRSIPSKKWWE